MFDQRPAIYETRVPFLSLFPRHSSPASDTPVDKTVTISIISLILRLIGRACNFLTIPPGLCKLVNEVTCVSTNARLFFCFARVHTLQRVSLVLTASSSFLTLLQTVEQVICLEKINVVVNDIYILSPYDGD